MKILSKIKRRNHGDALPHRGEYVEMDLFDTDRKPLEFPTGGGMGTQHQFINQADAPWTPVWTDPDATNRIFHDPEFTIDKLSYGGMFTGGRFNVNSGAES